MAPAIEEKYYIPPAPTSPPPPPPVQLRDSAYTSYATPRRFSFGTVHSIDQTPSTPSTPSTPHLSDSYSISSTNSVDFESPTPSRFHFLDELEFSATDWWDYTPWKDVDDDGDGYHVMKESRVQECPSHWSYSTESVVNSSNCSTHSSYETCRSRSTSSSGSYFEARTDVTEDSGTLHTIRELDSPAIEQECSMEAMMSEGSMQCLDDHTEDGDDDDDMDTCFSLSTKQLLDSFPLPPTGFQKFPTDHIGFHVRVNSDTLA